MRDDDALSVSACIAVLHASSAAMNFLCIGSVFLGEGFRTNVVQPTPPHPTHKLDIGLRLDEVGAPHKG